jgi:hypothetical protein
LLISVSPIVTEAANPARREAITAPRMLAGAAAL